MPAPTQDSLDATFLDANVLRGYQQTDIFLTLADHNVLEPRWSQEVLNEVRRNRPSGLSEAAIDRRLDRMNEVFPLAMVTDYEHLIPEMRADAKDKHVLAAAVHSESTTLVTENVKDFDPPTSGRNAIRVERTSVFLSKLLNERPEPVLAAMNEMISRTDREPNTMPALIEKMARLHDLKPFAEHLNAVVPPAQRSDKVAQSGLTPGQSATSRLSELERPGSTTERVARAHREGPTPSDLPTAYTQGPAIGRERGPELER
ncbi:PIN domain-containing protein [Luteipulveratus mongoliensis]|uniref:PIN domain-containing protein n=1 Tax=Luteipulveratus mongoliensis TaxID=571913 RepID=UPI000695F311|nr:PIN domain-containing protein [Luteipulveratus mongoliensis]